MSDSEFRYRAFLSYAHVDMKWGKWVHGRLEGYRPGRDQAGRATPLGPVPERIRPIFRDREKFTGGKMLTDATMEIRGQFTCSHRRAVWRRRFKRPGGATILWRSTPPLRVASETVPFR